MSSVDQVSRIPITYASRIVRLPDMDTADLVVTADSAIMHPKEKIIALKGMSRSLELVGQAATHSSTWPRM
jgi:hypothetical protein